MKKGAVTSLRAVTMWRSSWRMLWHNSTCLKMCLKLETQILAPSIRTKVLDFPIELIFDLILKFLELFKGFRLMLHQIDIPISTQGRR
jgi:hypothetical protein